MVHTHKQKTNMLCFPRKQTAAVCTDNDDSAALNDNDNKTAPQTKQSVEYDHRVATRVIEAMARSHSLGQPFFLAAGLRRPHLQWRSPHRFWRQYEHAEISVARHQTIGHNITTLAYEMNGEMGQVYTCKPGSPLCANESQQELQRQMGKILRENIPQWTKGEALQCPVRT